MVPEDNDQTELISEVTPLQALAYELHEMYTVLTEAGFPPKIAATIVAFQMNEMLANTMDASDMEEDEDDEGWGEGEDEDLAEGSAD